MHRHTHTLTHCMFCVCPCADPAVPAAAQARPCLTVRLFDICLSTHEAHPHSAQRLFDTLADALAKVRAARASCTCGYAVDTRTLAYCACDAARRDVAPAKLDPEEVKRRNQAALEKRKAEKAAQADRPLPEGEFHFVINFHFRRETQACFTD